MKKIFIVAVILCLLFSHSTGEALGVKSETWLNLSRVLDRFGTMTIKHDRILWASGQESEYKILDNNGGECTIELISNELPNFYDSTVQYLKMEVKFITMVGGIETHLEVSFYDNKDKFLEDVAIMWGVYVL